MYLSRAVLAASLAGFALSTPKLSQRPLVDWADASKKCASQNATLHLQGNDTVPLGAHFVHWSGQVFVVDSAQIPATEWTLIPQTDDKDGWRIYTTQPNGQQLWWYSTGYGIQLTDGYYSSTTFYMKVAFEERSPVPRVAMWASNRCMRFIKSQYEGVSEIRMEDKSYCAPIVLQPTTPTEWESSHKMCPEDPEDPQDPDSDSNRLHAELASESNDDMEPTGVCGPGYCKDYSNCGAPASCGFYTRCCSRSTRYPDWECGRCQCGAAGPGYTCN